MNTPESDVTENILNIDVGSRIRELRICNGYTLAKFAELIGVSDRHISYIETGERKLSIKDAIKIGSLFNLSLDYIYLGITDTSENDIAPICRLIMQTLNQISDKNTRELYENTIIQLSRLMIAQSHDIPG